MYTNMRMRIFRGCVSGKEKDRRVEKGCGREWNWARSSYYLSLSLPQVARKPAASRGWVKWDGV